MNVMQEPALAGPVDESEHLQAAWNQLNLVLGFFSRIDNKLSVVLGINLGLLALAGSRMPVFNAMTWWMTLFSTIFALALAASFYHLWRGAFPDLNGGTNSVVYFGSIAGMSEGAFRQAYGALPPAALADDLLNQVWRNSKILRCKFHSLRRSYVATLLAVLPWFALLTALPEKAAT